MPFPTRLRVADNTIASIDNTRLVACLAAEARAGDPAITDSVRARLAALRLEVEGEDDAGRAGTPRVNHGPTLIWLRAMRRLSAAPSTAAVSKALARSLSWTAPVYRLPGEQGPNACFCARPDVLLVCARAGANGAVTRAA